MTLWFRDVLIDGVFDRSGFWGDGCVVRCKVFGWVDASLESVVGEAGSVVSFEGEDEFW